MNGDRKKKVTGFWFEREVFESPAWRELTPTAMRVYFQFMLKRKLERVKYPRDGKKFRQTNNGEIEFTYKEAKDKHEISEGTFREALERLIEVGLIDIAESGAGLYKHKTLYGISERWRKFGKPDFERRQRPKDNRHVGYQKRNVRKVTVNAAKGPENGAGRLEAPPSQSLGGWQSIEGVGKTTRRQPGMDSDIKTSRTPCAATGTNVKPEEMAASEKPRGGNAGHVGKATRLSVGKSTLSSGTGDLIGEIQERLEPASFNAVRVQLEIIGQGIALTSENWQAACDAMLDELRAGAQITNPAMWLTPWLRKKGHKQMEVCTC